MSITLRELKKPDALLAGLRKFFDAITGHAKGITAITVAVLLAAAAFSYWHHHRTERSADALTDYYGALRTLRMELEAVAPKKAKAPPKKPAKAKDPKTTEEPAEIAAPEADLDAVMFKPMDVDATFAKAIPELKQVAEKHPKSLGGFQALMKVGGLYLDHGQSEKSITWFEQAIAQAPDSEAKAQALLSKGVALENLDRYAAAQEQYEAVSNLGPTLIRPEALLGSGRVLAAQGKNSEALGQLERVTQEYRDSAYAKTAEQAKQGLKDRK